MNSLNYTQCSCTIDDYEEAACSSTKLRKARKEHICCECGEKIQSGEQYEYVSGIWSGKPDEFKTCILCKRIREDLFYCGWIYGGLQEMIYECLGFNYLEYNGASSSKEDYYKIKIPSLNLKEDDTI